jgi:hypothetical protein
MSCHPTRASAARYIRIITEGLRHFGAAPSWIARIEAQPFNPARPRAQWLTAPEAPRSNGEALPLFTLAQLAEHKVKRVGGRQGMGVEGQGLRDHTLRSSGIHSKRGW